MNGSECSDALVARSAERLGDGEQCLLRENTNLRNEVAELREQLASKDATLLNQFAAAALPVILKSYLDMEYGSDEYDENAVALDSFTVAVAMLAETHRRA